MVEMTISWSEIGTNELLTPRRVEGGPAWLGRDGGGEQGGHGEMWEEREGRPGAKCPSM